MLVDSFQDKQNLVFVYVEEEEWKTKWDKYKKKIREESLGEEQSKRERRRRKTLRVVRDLKLMFLECVESPSSVKGETSK